MSPVDLLVDGLFAAFAHVVEALAIGIPVILITGRLLAEWLRSRRLMCSRARYIPIKST